HLVEITQAKPDQRVRILGFHFKVLLPGGGRVLAHVASPSAVARTAPAPWLRNSSATVRPISAAISTRPCREARSTTLPSIAATHPRRSRDWSGRISA